MEDNNLNRRNILKLLGLSAIAAVGVSTPFSSGAQNDNVIKLTPDQQHFMIEYEKWMDECIDIVRQQKQSPHSAELHKKMMNQSILAEQWQPQLREFMKDKNFALIYLGSIERMKKEI